MKTVTIAEGHDATVSQTFGPVTVDDTPGMYFQVSCSDPTITGTVQIQGSADNVSYFNLGTAMTITAGSTEGIDITTPCQYFKCDYANTGGTGTIKILVNIKEIPPI